jgi:hypothetical protein
MVGRRLEAFHLEAHTREMSLDLRPVRLGPLDDIPVALTTHEPLRLRLDEKRVAWVGLVLKRLGAQCSSSLLRGETLPEVLRKLGRRLGERLLAPAVVN